MKVRPFKKRYILLALIAVLAVAFYWLYDWRWNPWSAERLVWDEPNPQLIGKTFSFTEPVVYDIAQESLPTPVRKLGVVGLILTDQNYVKEAKDNMQQSATKQIISKPVNNSEQNWVPADPYPSDRFTLIETAEVFTIVRTYWIRYDYWTSGFRTANKYAMIKDTNNNLYELSFSDFSYTNHHEFVEYENSEYSKTWNKKNEHIAYNNF